MAIASLVFDDTVTQRYEFGFGTIRMSRDDDGLNPLYTLSEDDKRLTLTDQVYFQTVSLPAGRDSSDSNEISQIIDFTMDFWFDIGVPAEHKLWWGGFGLADGAFSEKIEPLIEPWWWLDEAVGETNEAGQIRRLDSNPRWTIRPEQLGHIMHCQLNVVSLFEDVA